MSYLSSLTNLINLSNHFSCRAFWRRTHQNASQPTYICKHNGGCILNVDNRRSCQKCRYDRCITSGMQPEAVLTDKQKEVRFQKFLQKKNQNKTEKVIIVNILLKSLSSKNKFITSTNLLHKNYNDKCFTLLSPK